MSGGQASSSFASMAQKPQQHETKTAVVHIDGLVVLKIVKHCRDSLPQMVAGSLLGLDQGSMSKLEVTHCFPFPAAVTEIEELNTTGEGGPAEGEAAGEGEAVADPDGEVYQMEMMKMLREVNVDNNCVGWYKSMHLGSFCQTPLIETQFSYQEHLSDNCVVLLYDPIQTAHGSLTLKAFRLSDAFVASHRAKKNEFIPPSEILQELPVKIRNPSLVSALLYDIGARQPGALDVDFDRFDLSSNPYLEKHLEYLCHWVDDLSEEQAKFGYYMRNVARQKQEAARNGRNGGDAPEEGGSNWRAVAQPNRLDSLLITNQIREYCGQINRYTGSSFSKLFLAGSLHTQ